MLETYRMLIEHLLLAVELLLLAVGLVACCAVIYALVNKNNRGRAGKKGSPAQRPSKTTPPTPAPQPLPEQPGKAWFEKQMESYSHDLLAFFISKLALEQRLTTAKIMELYEKYGRCPLHPSINEYQAGFRDTGLTASTMATVAENWLKSKNVQPDGTGWESQITSFLEAQQLEKAKKIVDEYPK